MGLLYSSKWHWSDRNCGKYCRVNNQNSPLDPNGRFDESVNTWLLPLSGGLDDDKSAPQCTRYRQEFAAIHRLPLCWKQIEVKLYEGVRSRSVNVQFKDENKLSTRFKNFMKVNNSVTRNREQQNANFVENLACHITKSWSAPFNTLGGENNACLLVSNSPDLGKLASVEKNEIWIRDIAIRKESGGNNCNCISPIIN